MVCFREVREQLAQLELRPTVAQLRWAIDSGKIDRPLLDASLRFDFTDLHIEQLVEYFHKKAAKRLEGNMVKPYPTRTKANRSKRKRRKGKIPKA